MRTFGKVWLGGCIVLLLISALVTVNAAGKRSLVPDATKPDLEKARQYQTLDQKLRSGAPLTEQDKQLVAEMAKMEASRKSGNPLDDQGGPDAFGYAFVDNVNGDTATYNWIELRGDAQATWINSWVSPDDGCATTQGEIGFNFPFYGESYANFWATSNGQIEFGTCNASYYWTCLPQTALGPMIAADMYDAHISYGGSNGVDVVGYRNFGNYTVIEYDSLGRCCSEGTSTKFEVILFSDGKIKLQYNQQILNGGTMGTVGIQDATGSTYLQYRCQSDGNTVRPLEDGRAIWFALPNGIPRPVTNLQGSVSGTDVTLTWTDPNQDTNGNPLTPDSLLIYRGNTQPTSQIGHVAHGVQTFSITESQGNLTYFVRAKAGTWLSTSVSVTVVVGNPGWSSTFETDNGGLTADGGWTWGTPSNPQAPAAHGGTQMWGTGMDANYSGGRCDHLDLAPGLVVLSPTATLEFWGWWSTYPFGPYDGVNVKVSIDEGNTWQTVTPQFPYFTQPIYNFNVCLPNEQAWCETSNGWQYVVVPIGDFQGQTPIFRFTFGTYLSGYPGFFLDDMTIWGIANPPDGVPRPVTNFAGTANGTTVTLNWTDPTQDTNGNPMVPDSVLIFRGNSQPASQIAHAAGGAQTITISNEPPGNTTYYARAKHASWTSLAVNTQLIVGSPTYFNNFDVDDGAWVPDNGIWQWGTPTNPQGPQPHSGTSVWAVGLTGQYNNSICGHLDLNLGLEVISPTATMEFWYWYQLEQGWDGVNVKVSVDDGATWTIVTPDGGYPGTTNGQWACSGQEAVWTGSAAGMQWTHAVLPIGQFLNQTPIFRITFGSDPSVQYAGFFLDDMIIWGLQPVQGANVSGTVTLDGGAGNVTQTQVFANGLGNPTTNPAANGTYTLTNVQVGNNRRIIATLANYFADTLAINLDSTGYTGANLTLRRMPPPAPTNLTGTVQTAARKDSLHWDISPDLLVDGYRVYRRIAGAPDWGPPRLTVLTRAHNWALDTLDTENVFEYTVTAIDTNVTNPPSESDRSNTVRNPFGHLPPVMLTANSNFDNKNHLTWLAPGAPPEREVFYDNGVNSPTVFGIRWLGQVPWGYFVSHFQTNQGPATITRIKIYFTQNATVDDRIDVAAFADDGTGQPTFEPLGLIETTQATPFDSFRVFELDTPVTITSGSFFVGARQVTANGICIGGDQVDPMINNTFYYASSIGTWWTFESGNLMAIPMIRAFVMGDIGGGLTAEQELAPAPVAVTAPMRPIVRASGFRTPVSKTVAALEGKTLGAVKSAEQGRTINSLSSVGPKTDRMVAGMGAPGVPSLSPGQIAERHRSSVAPHSPYMMASTLSHGRQRNALDDVVRFLIYRDNVLRDSVAGTVLQYDDVLGSTHENEPHSYFVRARWDDNVLSPSSDTLLNVRFNMAPGVPTGVAVTPVGQSQMRVTWTDPAINADNSACVDLAGIRVYRDGTLISTTPVAPGVQQYTDTPPDPQQVYTWMVKAIDEVPNEGAGATASGSVLSPWHTVEYDWVDISSIGTNTGLNADDQNVGPFDLGFNFTFYGQEYNSVRVCSNGWISFTSTSTSYNNTALPSPNTWDPTCAILPFWDDLYLPTGGSVMYYADTANERFIVAWLAVPHIGSGGPYTFEIILDSNGGITFEYQTTTPGESATVGVVNCDNSDAVELCYNGTGFWCFQDNSAVQFWGGPRQAIEGVVRHLGGTNPPLSNAQVWVTGGIDTMVTDVDGNYTLPIDSAGTYTVNFRHATHCDSIRTGVVVEENVNTTLNVSMRAPNATLNVTSLTFVVHRFLTQPQTFTITNNGGNCPLHYQVLDSVAWLSSDPAAGTVDPGQTVTITVTAAPGQIPVGEYHTTIRVVGDAPGTPLLLQVDMNVLTVDPGEPGLPTEFALHGNYPNPFNPTTVLPFDLPQQSQVDLIVYNVMGQEVARPVSGVYAAGRYNATFDAAGLPSGLYLVKMTAGHYTGMRKIMLLK